MGAEDLCTENGLDPEYKPVLFNAWFNAGIFMTVLCLGLPICFVIMWAVHEIKAKDVKCYDGPSAKNKK